MTIEKTNRINALLDFYEPLLTQKQTKYIDYYYREDLSLGEIAENYHVSRQAVYDNIKRTENILTAYEEKLQLYQQFQRLNQQIEQIKTYAVNQYPEDTKLLQLLERLESIEE
ncbi:MAG: putative DNA-binding protein [Liquorilactobacillus ghanensis]|jgi:predicted DNA-binding protein YlxM (UPF0122 family)|uniref:UPF0122 protein FC89_GL000086 n=1 Tax=Liquorilactobacillus ghanensis DSM 18630 TaxID=1423750 RepID=A0A0R1VQ81_9LACO|nr:putative DNA-binding protein [Liquorilactobacillus ghanensis]KRM07647.1 Signal recognition particle associated protein [Liquorilactobacillus ghanensis DSM 18630]